MQQCIVFIWPFFKMKTEKLNNETVFQSTSTRGRQKPTPQRTESPMQANKSSRWCLEESCFLTPQNALINKNEPLQSVNEPMGSGCIFLKY